MIWTRKYTLTWLGLMLLIFLGLINKLLHVFFYSLAAVWALRCSNQALHQVIYMIDHLKLCVLASMLQIHSRTPNPGPAFIEKYKAYLANFGYIWSKQNQGHPTRLWSYVHPTVSLLPWCPCLAGMQKALTNEFPDLELRSSVQFNPFTSVFVSAFAFAMCLHFK